MRDDSAVCNATHTRAQKSGSPEGLRPRELLLRGVRGEAGPSQAAAGEGADRVCYGKRGTGQDPCRSRKGK